MTGFPAGDGDLHRLRIAHLAADDDVGRLAGGGAKRGGEVGRIDADLDVLEPAAQARRLPLHPRRPRRAGAQLRDDRVEIVGFAHDTTSPVSLGPRVMVSLPAAVRSGTGRAG